MSSEREKSNLPKAANPLALCSRGLHQMLGKNAEVIKHRFRPDSVRCRECHNAQRRERYHDRRKKP